MKLAVLLVLLAIILLPQQSFARNKHKTKSYIQMPSSISEITPLAPTTVPSHSNPAVAHSTPPPTRITSPTPTPIVFDLHGYDVNEDFSTNTHRTSWSIFDRIVSAVLKNMLGQFGFFSMLV